MPPCIDVIGQYFVKKIDLLLTLFILSWESSTRLTVHATEQLRCWKEVSMKAFKWLVKMKEWLKGAIKRMNTWKHIEKACNL